MFMLKNSNNAGSTKKQLQNCYRCYYTIKSINVNILDYSGHLLVHLYSCA